MKGIMIGTACIVTFGILVGTFFFEKYPEITTEGREQGIGIDDSKKAEQPDPLQPIYESDSIGYSLQNGQLQITFNKGNDWVKVPVEKEKLFEGEYSGTKEELIENSYTLTQDYVSFLYSDGTSPNGKSVKLLFSQDQGKTWVDVVVKEHYPPIRFRKVEFLDESFGYVIISGDRTMSQEWTTVYITKDGGKQWEETTHSNVTRLISDGGFVDENTGFLSFGILNPEEPDLYVTQDGGESWSQAGIDIPEKYHEIFVMAEVPFYEEEHLSVYINQGPNGDYQGGKVKGKFISKDKGKTWIFSMEVTPNETS